MLIRADKARLLAVLIFSSFFATHTLAAPRGDYDIDDNGLIEINDLDDLNEIRNNLDGTSLYGSSVGCPSGGCNGFELTTSLDFDTNADGVIDASDSYWNSGSGWDPLGDNSAAFSAIFNGNGFLLRNLFIDRPSSNDIGLFGIIQNASITNLGLTGQLMRIRGNTEVGGLVGSSYATSTISNSFSTGMVVSSSSDAGGLIGRIQTTTNVSNCFATGPVSISSLAVGGLVGYISLGDGSISNSFATGVVNGSSSVGGLVGYSGGATITNSHWATDISGQEKNNFSDPTVGFLGETLANLQCATTPYSTSCGSNTLYSGWDTAIWDFGTSSQLPALILNGTIYRDSDGDGVLDADDPWPALYAAFADTDSDGYPDSFHVNCDADCISASGLVLDGFPDSAAAWQDDDLDGYPDSWADDCDTTCQNGSGLTLDSFLDDQDNDGLDTASDSDDDNDGITDADADSDGLIEITSLEQLNAMRFDLYGHGRVLSDGGASDRSGCPTTIYQGTTTRICSGYELTADLDFDTSADGTIDALDTYWRNGTGWEPVGDSSDPFASVFNGNGHLIRNLFINQPTTYRVGLFGVTENASITNLGLTGDAMKLVGQNYVGGFVGRSETNTVISNCFSTGTITAQASYAGGLVGRVEDGTRISNCFATGPVAASTNMAGGLVGYLSSNSASLITNSFSSGSVSSTTSAGGLAGYSGRNFIGNSYWATDSSGQPSSSRSDSSAGYIGAPLSKLQCPTVSDADLCFNETLYSNWDSSRWDFGTMRQLPGLIIDGEVYRDSDSDGILDRDEPDDDHDGVPNDSDDLPLDSSETVDIDGDKIGNNADTDDDGDGVLDTDDAFPNHFAASVDADNDGLPDAWNSACDTACQNDSGLTLDTVESSESDSSGGGGGFISPLWFLLLAGVYGFRQHGLRKKV